MNSPTATTTAQAVRNLIVCDTQFGWTGSTSLKLQEMLDLQARGWVAEGAENNEFDLTDAGRAIVDQALQFAVPATLATVKPGGSVLLARPDTDPQPSSAGSFPLVDLLDIRNQLHVMATTVVPNFCDMAAGLQGQVQELIDRHRRAHAEQFS